MNYTAVIMMLLLGAISDACAMESKTEAKPAVAAVAADMQKVQLKKFILRPLDLHKAMQALQVQDQRLYWLDKQFVVDNLHSLAIVIHKDHIIKGSGEDDTILLVDADVVDLSLLRLTLFNRFGYWVIELLMSLQEEYAYFWPKEEILKVLKNVSATDVKNLLRVIKILQMPRHNGFVRKKFIPLLEQHSNSNGWHLA